MQEVYNLAENHIKQKLDQKLINPKIYIKELPDTLELKACLEELEFSSLTSNSLASRVSLLTTCPNPYWKFFLTVEIDAQVNALVATRAIPRHKHLTSEDISLKPITLAQARRGMLTSLEQLTETRAKRNINPGTTILINMLEETFLVEKDKEVTLVVDIKGVEITAKGTALENGKLQDYIQARNNNSQKIVSGTVIAPNTIRVN